MVLTKKYDKTETKDKLKKLSLDILHKGHTHTNSALVKSNCPDY